MRCAACAQAICGGAEYRAGCMGCAARAIARCDAMRKAMDKTLSTLERLEATREVRELMSRTMPGVSFYVARAEVLQWWTVDEANRSGVNSAGPTS